MSATCAIAAAGPNALPAASSLSGISGDLNFVFTTTTSNSSLVNSRSSLSSSPFLASRNDNSSTPASSTDQAMTACCSPNPVHYISASAINSSSSSLSSLEMDRDSATTCSATSTEAKSAVEAATGVLWCELSPRYSNKTLVEFSSCLLGQEGWDYRVLGGRLAGVTAAEGNNNNGSSDTGGGDTGGGGDDGGGDGDSGTSDGGGGLGTGRLGVRGVVAWVVVLGIGLGVGW